MTSPPAIAGDSVIAGSAIGDNRAVELELGIERAFDARTGERRWSWDLIPRSVEDQEHTSWRSEQAARPVVALRASTGDLVWHRAGPPRR